MQERQLPSLGDTPPAVEAFIKRWEKSGAAERANYQLFLSELCDVIGVPRPNPAGADDSQNDYVFERAVVFQHGDGNTSTGRIDLYKRVCFVLEAKQGANVPDPDEALSEAARELKRKLKMGTARRGTAAWDDAMLRARGQAEQYGRALPASEGRPPFLIVVDVGHTIELYSEFSCTGGTYIPFPAPGSHRIFLQDLERPDIRERLRLVWTAPHDLDPSRRSARVTREIAASLARLAVLLEKDGHDPHIVAAFLMRGLFTMFAEDVGLLARNSFSNLLLSLRDKPQDFVPVIEELWGRMDRGGYSISLRMPVLQFNGGLFESATALPLSKDQLQLLIEAAQCDWRDVEPAIFGTLLERALAPEERHKLGAHYTPRAYVERLVMPTIVEPIRAEWETARAAAVTLANKGDIKKAAAGLKAFHRRLCHTRILDPACGSGNFLYVTLEHLKRIEGEVLDTLNIMGERQAVLEMAGETVGPHQFLGLEINPRAAAIAELVLWIGTLQWHFRNRGNVNPPQPIIRNFHNIQCRDALIEYDKVEPVLDDQGQPVTRWDGRTTKPHPVTGREVPDETFRVPTVRYINPRPAVWPEADYVVGNPPFIGPALMRQSLGDGYTETVREVHSDMGESSDFVMYWWNHAAKLAREKKIQRFGFITTNSLRQTFSRRVLETHLAADPPLSILFAIPDHPWVDSADGAAVRIAMTVATAGIHDGVLSRVVAEKETEGDGYEVALENVRGRINADLTIGADVAGAKQLSANGSISCPGVKLHGAGFIVTSEEALNLGFGRIQELRQHIRNYRNGRDLTTRPRAVMVIDLFSLSESQVRSKFPSVYQWILERVKPERDQNNRKSYKDKWWIFGEPREDFRPALMGLSRYIATVETSKYRFFVFLDESILPDNMLVNIALDDAHILGVLSSRLHTCWALATGGILGPTPRYNKTRCFETFPFPVVAEAQKTRIRDLAEQLDAHRKRQQAEHPDLTMTGMYNVLEKLRANAALTDAERKIHEEGLVSVLKQLHDDLDAAVFAAYGWPTTLTDQQILEKLVALNAERAAEEEKGTIRWLRPDYQCRGEKARQTELDVGHSSQKVAKTDKKTSKPKPLAWPKALPDQVRLLRELLATQSAPVTAQTLAKSFTRARVEKVEELLQALVTLGQARSVGEGKYLAG
ncbi:MAG: DNA methyltransferase [bacterium]